MGDRWNTILCPLLIMMLLGLSGCGLIFKQIPPGEIHTPVLGAQECFIKVGEVNYHYAEYPADGEDILMVHGFASSTYAWQKVAPLLQKKGYHVWTLDMKGFGWSDKPKGARYDAHTLMEEVRAWMEAVGLRKSTFVGNSLGGAVGVLMALEHPEKIDRLILLDPAGYPQKKPLVIRMASIPGSISAMKLIFGRWMVSWNLKEVFYHQDWITQEGIDAYYYRLRTEGALDAQASVIEGLDFEAFATYIKRIPEIKHRTLIVWGKDDRWIPLENGVKYRRDLSNSTLVVIPQCGHMPQEEYPDLTARVILDFLAGTLVTDTILPVAPAQAS